MQHFFRIVYAIDHKLQLKFMSLHQPPNDPDPVASRLMNLMPAPRRSRIGRRTAKFGTDRDQIALQLQINSPSGLDRQVLSSVAQSLAQLNQRAMNHRLASRDDDVPQLQRERFLQNFIHRQVRSLWLPGRKGRVAKPAAQIASARSHKHARRPGQQPFALVAGIDLANAYRRPLSI